MYAFNDAADLAVEATSQLAAITPGWVPLVLSGVAVLIALASSWVNWRAMAPKLAVRLEAADQRFGTNYLTFRVVNEGKIWVDNIRIRWHFDPTNLWHSDGDWAQDSLNPGESYTARISVPSSFPSGGDERDQYQGMVDTYHELAEIRPGKRRLGKATYKRQVGVPFIRTRQRVSLPPLPHDFHAAAHAHFQARAEQLRNSAG